MSDLEIRLSGAVEVARAGEPVALPGRRIRALCVLLGVSVGRSVSVDELVKGLWDDDPPERVRGSLQTYVGRLRRVVGSDLVVTDPNGYTLNVSRADVDLLRFQDLVDRAGDDDTESERTALHAALALWRGDPFGDPPSAWIERQLVSVWVERHLQALERRIDLDLDAGDHAACVPELRDLVERYPLRETLWLRLLTALHHGGRTAEALERYEVLRTRLAEELGVDPTPELQAAYQRLLSSDPPAPTSRPAVAVPHQLPGRIGGFTGRVQQLEALDAAADSGGRLFALHGPGGVGKTTLAVHWSRRSRERFPGGELFVDLRGYGPGEPLSAHDALDSLLRGIGFDGSRIPSDEDGRSALLRSELADSSAVLLLDNARDVAQVRPLLPGGDNLVIVTSRSQLRSLAVREGARRVPVTPMPTADAVALLRNRLGDDDAPSYRENLVKLAELCGRLPVALAVAAERAGRDGTPRLELVNERLRSERERLATLSDWDDDPLTGVRAVFAWSYDVLDAEVARMFRLLGLHPEPRVELGAAAALAGAEPAVAERLIDRLTDGHLVRELGDGWYDLHDLTHVFAAEVCAEADSEDERSAAVARLRDWYVHSADHADGLLGDHLIDHVTDAPMEGTTPAEFARESDAAQWFAEHVRTIRAVLGEAIRDGDHRTVALLMPSFAPYLRRSGAVGEGLERLQAAQPSAVAVRSRLLEAIHANQLGNAYTNLGRLDAGLENLLRARSIYEDLGEERGQLVVDINLGINHGRRGEPDVEVRYYESARELALRHGHHQLTATLQNNLATCYLELDRVDEAQAAAVEAADIARVHDVPKTVLTVMLLTLAETQSATRRWNEAHTTLLEAIDLCRRIRQGSYEVYAHWLMGSVHRALGSDGDARASWTAALDLLDRVDAAVFTGVSADDLRARIAELPEPS